MNIRLAILFILLNTTIYAQLHTYKWTNGNKNRENKRRRYNNPPRPIYNRRISKAQLIDGQENRNCYTYAEK